MHQGGICMKRFRVVTTTASNNTIDIVIHFYDEEYDIAANMYIHHPSIKKRYKISQAQLDELDEFIGNVLSMIVNFRFNVVSHGQASKGYSYYIDFYPVDENGNQLELWQIRFRISDHRQKIGRYNRVNRIDDITTISEKSHVLIKSFEIGEGHRFGTLESAMTEMKRICMNLQKGQYF